MNGTIRKRVLVVDDEPDVRSYLRMALEDAGFEVETACDGLEATKAVLRQTPDLISLDLVMPRHSGVRFYQDLRRDTSLSKIPVLVVTGHARDELGRADFQEMILSGPGVYLEKPVSPEKYVSAVRQMLGIDESSTAADDTAALRAEVTSALSGADRGALEQALAVLRKR